MPTMTQLEYVLAVDRLRHFGKAAESCHVSQPSLSSQIQKVEEEMGFALFDRGKKPIIPTDRGAKFIEQAKIILRENQKLKGLIQNRGSDPFGEFRLGIIPTLSPYILPLFIEEFSQKYSKVRLEVDEMKTESIISGLKDDSLDGGILATPLGESGIKEKVLFYENFYLFVGPEHRLAKRMRIKEEDLDSSEMWLLQDGHCLRNQVIRICSLSHEQNVFKNIRFEGGNLETLRYLVKRSRGYTLLPQLFVNTLPENERKNLIKEFVDPVPCREVSLVYHRDQWKSDILQAIENMIVKNLPRNVQRHADKKAEVVAIAN